MFIQHGNGCRHSSWWSVKPYHWAISRKTISDLYTPKKIILDHKDFQDLFKWKQTFPSYYWRFQHLGQAFSQPKAFYIGSACLLLKINIISNNSFYVPCMSSIVASNKVFIRWGRALITKFLSPVQHSSQKRKYIFFRWWSSEIDFLYVPSIIVIL